jgi:hypothetical protein
MDMTAVKCTAAMMAMFYSSASLSFIFFFLRTKLVAD